MENEPLIDKIKSKYIFELVIPYIKDDDFKYKLFFYSKLYQKKFDCKIIYYRNRYIEKLKINLTKYLYFQKYYLIHLSGINKDELRKKLKDDLFKYKIDDIN